MNKQKNKQGHRLNFFDILLVILLLVILSLAGIFFFMRPGKVADWVNVRYTVLVKNVPVTMHTNLEEGQNVINSVDMNPIGTVVKVEMKPCEYDQFNKIDGELYHGSHEDLINIAVTIETKAEETAKEFRIDNMHACIGTQIHFRTPGFVGYGYITDFNVVGKSDSNQKED